MAGNEQTMMSEEAFMERMRNYVAPDPSPRNHRVSKHSSHPDRIEAACEADGHTTWGYVIYRTTYENDADWIEFMRRLRAWTEETMDFYNGQDVLDQMTWTVFDDREHFDGADSATIRRHFRDWAETAVQDEQPRRPDGTPAVMGRSPRYRYCVQVDAEALKASVHEAPAPPEHDQDRQGWVKLIEKKWLPRSELLISVGRQPDRNPKYYEAIDGGTEYDVGWIRCPATDVLTQYYVEFQDLNGYAVDYRRPPALIGYPWTSIEAGPVGDANGPFDAT